MQHPPSRSHLGFTLIEVMIVVAMLAILTAIALPSYQAYIQRSHRAEARAALLAAAQWMERSATATGNYPSGLPTSLVNGQQQSYTVSLATDGNSPPTSFTLSAVPKGSQVTDKCGTYTLKNTSARGVIVGGAAGAQSLVTECWGR